MSLASVRAFFATAAPHIEILETRESSASVAEAAAAHGVAPERIAKTLSLRVNDEVILLVARGDARLDNGKFKSIFGGKPRMLEAAEVEAVTGHPVGGVSPFGLAQPLQVFCDLSLQAFDEVVPAAGSTNSAIRISPMMMAELAQARWVDVCRVPE
jgi:prolyl-tRNA editing enzyme YbaK/EbsC (Cys-tRNA(Pro) deacylase)